MLNDLKFALRQLLKNPSFTAVAVLTLALGIGASTAIFSVVNALLLKPLPYDQPGQLVQLFEAPRPGQQNSVSPGVFLDWREQSTAFEDFAAYNSVVLNFIGTDEPERLNGLRMSASGLHLLRARPLVGRIFTPDEDQAGKEKIVMLTHQLWQRRFGGNRDVVGRAVLLNDESYTVIGVLPAGFLPFEAQEFVIPFVFPPSWKNQRDNHQLRVIARLKPGVPIERANAELNAIAQRSKSLYPAWKQDWSVTLIPLEEQLVQEIKPALLVLFGAVGLVLLIACTNVANLLLAKASARQKEIAIRGALGASRARLVQQLLTESVLLSVFGAGFGLVIASWSVSGLRHVLGSMSAARAHEVTLDVGVLGFAIVVSVITGLGFGLIPALQASRPNLNHELKDAARGSATGGNRLRSSLIVGEVALALVLLVGAGLLLHSFSRLLSVPPGFNPERALTLQLSLSDQKYPDNPRRVAFYNRVAERVAALPGVEAAGLSRALPLLGGAPDMFFRIPGRANHRQPGYSAIFDFCTSEYFRAMGIPLLRGRFFSAHEVTADARVAIINSTAAREFFPDEDPLGQRIGLENDTWEIVGIVGDVRMRGLTRSVAPVLYRPQAPGQSWRSASLVVRTRSAPLSLVESVRQAIREIDPAQPVANVRTLDEVVGASVAQRRLTLISLCSFAAVALLLAAIGLYGVIAYVVTQRTREFGIRFALGASRRDVLQLVLGHGIKLVALGLVLGLAGAFSLTHLLTKLLYEIKPTDPLTFSGVSAVLLVVALCASWLPARRAAKVDPMEALRHE
jgi:predicted permease